jgi:hypothetical protein
MMNGWEFMTKDCAVVPFSPGTVVWVDGMLSTIYYGLKRLNRLELTLCGDNPTHDEFVRAFDPSKKVLQILCEVRNQGAPTEDAVPVGAAWVEMPKGTDGERAAMCGFAFFKPTRRLLDLGRMGIRYWMHGLKIDVVHGVMLEMNYPARRFATRLGFKQMAKVPRFHFHQEKLVDAVAVTLDKKDFDPSFEAWSENQKSVAELV